MQCFNNAVPAINLATVLRNSVRITISFFTFPRTFFPDSERRFPLCQPFTSVLPLRNGKKVE